MTEEEIRRRREELLRDAQRLERLPPDDPLTTPPVPEAFDPLIRRLLGRLPAPGAMPDEVVEREEFQQYLQEQINRLPRGPALAFLFHHLGGMTYTEIGELFGISPREARLWAELARTRLAEALVRDGWVEARPETLLRRRADDTTASERHEWMQRAQDLASRPADAGTEWHPAPMAA